MADVAWFESADVEEDDDGQSYTDKVNAPLSREALEALRAELESEEYARSRSPRRGKRDPNVD